LLHIRDDLYFKPGIFRFSFPFLITHFVYPWIRGKYSSFLPLLSFGTLQSRPFAKLAHRGKFLTLGPCLVTFVFYLNNLTNFRSGQSHIKKCLTSSFRLVCSSSDKIWSQQFILIIYRSIRLSLSVFYHPISSFDSPIPPFSSSSSLWGFLFLRLPIAQSPPLDSPIPVSEALCFFLLPPHPISSTPSLLYNHFVSSSPLTSLPFFIHIPEENRMMQY